MAAVGTARIIEQLLKRFEAFECVEPIEILSVECSRKDLFSKILPSEYEHFSKAPKVVSCRRGKVQGDDSPAIKFYLSGPEGPVKKFLVLAESAGEQLGGLLGQAHLLKQTEVHGRNGTAEQCLWLIALINAVGQRRLPGFRLDGEDHFFGNCDGEDDWVVSRKEVERFYGPEKNQLGYWELEWMYTFAAGADSSKCYARLKDALEPSISLLNWLHQWWENPKKGKADPKQGVRESDELKLTTTDILKAMFERADGKELLVGATVRELSAKIKKSPSSISSNAFWKKEIVPLREAWKAKIKADHNAVINAKARSEDDFGRDVQ